MDDPTDRLPAILITGEPGWLSGPCPAGPLPGPLAGYAAHWQIDAQEVPAWTAVRHRGTEVRIVVAFGAAELAAKLAAKLAAAEDADGT